MTSRNKRQLLLLGIATALVLCSGCVSSTRLGLSHYSHLSAGKPFGPRSEEDSVTLIEASARWQLPLQLQAELGLGYNLKGRNGGGFYGPAEVTSVKLYREWRFK